MKKKILRLSRSRITGHSLHNFKTEIMSEESCTLAIIGDGSTGKSTIINAFRTEGFQAVYKQTIGCDFYEKQLVIRNNHRISLRVWDIGGQSIHSKNMKGYLENTNAVMLVYDVTNLESFHNLSDWLTQLKKYNSSCLIYLAGNKVDLIPLRQVTERQHESFILENYLKGGCYCSAKTGENVVKLFYQISAERMGIQLTASELAYYDKVLKAYIVNNTSRDEARNAWAEDM
jgi:small GTP-binding protein